MIRCDEINDRAQNRRGLFRRAAGDGVANCFRGNSVLEREAEQHAGVARDRLDVVPGLAAVNEDFARRAVGIETDGDRERLVPRTAD